MCDTCEACNPGRGHSHASGSAHDPGHGSDGRVHSHDGLLHSHDEHSHEGHVHSHDDHGHSHDSAGADLDLGILDENDDCAERNRGRLERAGVRCINLMSSPGSGKTTLLERTLAEVEGTPRIGVIEGDMTTELDADRLRAYGAPVVAITTGRSCHLEAEQIAGGLDAFDQTGGLDRFDLLVIENVGNLICPAAFELGEHARVVLVAVTEGEDKPLKYPYMFHGADCVVITKLDLAPYLRLDIEKLRDNIRQITPRAEVFAVSAETGDGMSEWLRWLRCQVAARTLAVDDSPHPRPFSLQGIGER